MTENNTLFIVIPTFGAISATKRCVDSIQGSAYQNISTIIVDHGKDKTGDTTDWPKNTVYLRESSSLWWTGAVNRGIRAALERNAGLIMLLNDDCIVPPDTINGLLSCINKTVSPAIVAPMQVDPVSHRNVSRVTSCFPLGFPTLILPTIGSGKYNKSGLIRTPLILGGRGVIIPSSVFKNIGYFDEEMLPHYGSDHDFYIRCRKNGVPLYVCPKARILTDSTSTSAADSPGHLSLREFIDTLYDRKSHRNITDLNALYKKHYPVKSLYFIGVTLNLARYIIVYTYKRLVYLIAKTIFKIKDS